MHKAIGWRDRESGLPMTTNTLFDLASMTKPIIATEVLRLAERGVVALDDPVGKYLSEFANGRASRVTIAHLLNHTSGFRVLENFVGPILQRYAQNPTAPSLRLEVTRIAAVGPV